MADRLPVILVADRDPAALRATESELRKRYAADYELACEDSERSAATAVERFRRDDRAVALVLVDRFTPRGCARSSPTAARTAARPARAR
jgi:hypothetical protein